MEVRVSINPLEVLLAHQKKSGSNGRQSGKSNSSTRHEATMIAPEVWQLVLSAERVAAQFKESSASAHETVEQMFLVLIQQYGVDVCADVLCSVVVRGDKERQRKLSNAAFRSLIKLRLFKQAKSLISRMKIHPLQRMGLYCLMGVNAIEEDRQEILAEMRLYAETIAEWSNYFDARYRIFLVSGLPEDQNFLNRNMARRFYSGQPLSVYDVTIMLEMNLIDERVDGARTAIAALEQMGPGPAREIGENRFRQMITAWERVKVLQLHAALHGSRYQDDVRQVALDMRDPEKDSELEEGMDSAPIV